MSLVVCVEQVNLWWTCVSSCVCLGRSICGVKMRF